MLEETSFNPLNLLLGIITIGVIIWISWEVFWKRTEILLIDYSMIVGFFIAIMLMFFILIECIKNANKHQR